MEQKLHTPEGVRDIYNSECRKKLSIQEQLQHVLHIYGYQDIQTPTFEYFDVFREEIGTISSRELYKFFDREGNTLALRPDITPSIARAAATLFESEERPVRLCYVGNTFINYSSYRGKLKENTQLGAELIGMDSIEADAEMIAMVVDGLKRVGLKEFQVNIGHVDFMQSLMDAANLESEDANEVHHLILNRNYFGVEEILDRAEVETSVKTAFETLPELMGGAEILKQARQVSPNERASLAVSYLGQLYEILKLYGVEKNISFDLSMSGSYGYYTGVVFRAYTYGTGDAIVRGGRYDNLLEKFGKSTPSIGFAIIVDELMSALSRQKIPVETSKIHMIVYTDTTENWAISLAKDFREKGKCVEMHKRLATEQRKEYEAYGARVQAFSMLYLQDDFTIDMVNLATGEVKRVNAGREQ